MTETLTAASVVPPTFAGRRLTRTATALASSGLLVGMGTVGAAPAFAAEASDCSDANTVDSGDSGTAADIQTLLDADTAIVCLAGSFTLASELTFDHDLELFGLAGAQLNGNDATRMLLGSGGASLSVQNISFVNGSDFVGGAIYVDGAVFVENSQFVDNNSVENGGAIYVSGSNTVDVVGSTFTNNATGPEFDGIGYSGGAIFAAGNSTVFIDQSTFTGNEASDAGGAVLGYQVLAELSEFTDNSAPLGGAILGYAAGTFDSTFDGNSADEGGALRVLFYGVSFGSTFVDNTASNFGGAIAAGFEGEGEGQGGYGIMLSLNSTFVDNTAGVVGGAILADYGQIALSTFLNNEANTEMLDERSDAIFMTGDDESMDLAGNIFAGSRPHAQLGSLSENAFDDLGGNVFSTTEAAESALGSPHESTQFSRSVASLFGAAAGLAANGGPTQTVALVAGSPAIDAVPAPTLGLIMTSASASLAPAQERVVDIADLLAASDSADVDQRSVERTGLADAGAFEYGDAELAATGADSVASGWLAGLAALLLASGAAIALRARRLARVQR